MCLIGPLLGVVGLAQIRYGSGYKGRGPAIAGIVLGLLFAAGWSAAAVWWHVNVRRMYLWGPRVALQQGLDGDVAAFRSAFIDPDASTADAEAAAFLDALRSRYGRLRSTARQDEAVDMEHFDRARPRLAYRLDFERRSVGAEVQFAARDDTGAFSAPRVAWIVILDPVEGDLAYPLSALPVEPHSEEADNKTDGR